MMRGEGKSFGYFQKFNLPSIDVVCHDIAHYEHRSILYVGCISKDSSPTKPGSVFVATWSYEQAKVTSIAITPQDDGFRILNRVGMFITKTGSGSSSTPYLTVYDSGNTNSKTHRGNDQVRIYRNIEIGALKFYKLLKVDDHQYDIVYNMFDYEGSIIIAGRVNGPTSGIVTLAQCGIDFTNKVLACNKDLKTTSITEGMVGLTFATNQYYEINSETGTIQICNLKGSFHDADWNRNVILTQHDLELIHHENSYIRSYSGNTVLGTINYGSTTQYKPDAGYTGISYESGISWSVEGYVAANIGNSIVSGKRIQDKEHGGDVISIMRPDKPYLLIEASKLSGKTVVGVNVHDSSSPTTFSTSATVTVVDSIYDKINVLSTAYGDITVKGGFETSLHLKDEDIIEGNNMEIEAHSADGTVHGKSFSGAKVDITWNPSHDHNDIIKYAFFQQKALVQNKRGKMWFYNCKIIRGHHERHCEQFASYPGPISQPVRTIKQVGNILFTWTCTDDDCFAIFAQENGDVSTVSLGAGIRDIFIGEDDVIPNWIRIVATSEGKVEIFKGPKYEPEGVTLWYTMTDSNANEPWFCPTHAFHCPLNQDVLLIMNDCEGYNQKILKYRIGDSRVNFIESSKLDSLTQAPFFCPMGHEFIIGSVDSKHDHPLYSFSAHDDLNFWTVPKDLLGDNFWNYSCLSHMFRSVSYGFDKDGSVTATTIVGNRGSQQLSRYSTVVSGIEATAAYAYEGFHNSVLHWFLTSNGPLFYETFDHPILELTTPKVTEETQKEVTFTFTNSGKGKRTFTKSITVLP
jgi:hypothetical protein